MRALLNFLCWIGLHQWRQMRRSDGMIVFAWCDNCGKSRAV